jgi:hypothetical protein
VCEKPCQEAPTPPPPVLCLAIYPLCGTLLDPRVRSLRCPPGHPPSPRAPIRHSLPVERDRCCVYAAPLDQCFPMQHPLACDRVRVKYREAPSRRLQLQETSAAVRGDCGLYSLTRACTHYECGMYVMSAGCPLTRPGRGGISSAELSARGNVQPVCVRGAVPVCLVPALLT